MKPEDYDWYAGEFMEKVYEDAELWKKTGDILDLSKAALDWSSYSGSEKKYSLTLDGIQYMVKFPDPVRQQKNDLRWMNNQFSEYVGCHIYESIGAPVQKTYLGEYTFNEKKVIVVCCRDFINDGLRLYPMKFIYSQDVFESKNIRGKLTIQKVYESVEGLKDPELEREAIDHFWKMFVVDYLIGNYDRHLENWGMSINSVGSRAPAPVYDCGSSLFPLKSDDFLLGELGKQSFNGDSLSVLTVFHDEKTGCRLSFKEIIESPLPDLEKAIKEVFPKIDLVKIYQILQGTPFMSDIRKTAMIESIKIRYNQVLLKEYVRLEYEELSSYEQNKLIRRIKSRNTAAMREHGYVPLSQLKKMQQ